MITIRPIPTGDDLRERAAKVMGWSFQETCTLSIGMLQEAVRTKDPQLARDIAEFREKGRAIIPPYPPHYPKETP